MRKLRIIGIGVGNPDHMTIEGVTALQSARVIFVPDKGAEKEDLRRPRHDICTRFLPPDTYRVVEFPVLQRHEVPAGYRQGVEDWHGRIADQYADLLRRELRAGETGAFLVWGDPSLYDSTIRIIDKVRASAAFDLDYDVIPGITSVQVLAARHRVPLNSIGGAVQVTTGRRLSSDATSDEADSVVVMLDGEQAFTRLDRDAFDIYWGAYLGTAKEILIAGRLADVADEIVRVRAAARAANGWIMDTYVLRRRTDR